ncbi:hypothetical protein T11_8301 [Trichinella zimbabwensis]|uniref:Uncharacterized protein n=1 Tax=Trichinella zimbabwensis TaxID=268475 RepID=A0A0V1I2A9_9BILA|nr:hypothetical protein T11_8301 [Trichinella zimbabwensis]
MKKEMKKVKNQNWFSNKKYDATKLVPTKLDRLSVNRLFDNRQQCQQYQRTLRWSDYRNNAKTKIPLFRITR